MDEAIKYRIKTPRDGGPTGPVVIAGPTCDEVDVLYDKAGYEMPLDLQVGDKILVLSAGAYTATYCSTGFNGFPPLKEYYI
jgi:ornithine decarboxylase